jgi:hypothetical protein
MSFWLLGLIAGLIIGWRIHEVVTERRAKQQWEREAAEDNAFEERMWRELKAQLLEEQRQRDATEARARWLPPKWRDAAYAKRN